jgi:hypothetical protein
MKHLLMRRRPGTTLFELIIFLGVLAVVIGLVMPLLFSAAQDRLFQQTVSVVEQNGTQVLQNTSIRIRQSERILSPLPGEVGSVLALQSASGATNPTIIGVISGALVIVEHATKQTVSSSQVAVDSFTVRNTSVSPTHQSVQISFKLSRSIRLEQPHSYAQTFSAAVTLFPADTPKGDTCGCAAPVCNANDVYQWQVCEGTLCSTTSTQLHCP